MKRDIAKFVSRCLLCQQVKVKHRKPLETLQPLPNPERKWEHINIDFIVDLPRTRTSYDASRVIVDRLTKLAHFLAMHSTFCLKRLAKLYINEIVKLHGVSISIVSDQDPRFTSQFWPKLQKALVTTLHFSTVFHPQINGQSKRTIQTLEDMLRACVLEFKDSWVDHLSLIELTSNNSYQTSIGVAPYEAL